MDFNRNDQGLHSDLTGSCEIAGVKVLITAEAMMSCGIMTFADWKLEPGTQLPGVTDTQGLLCLDGEYM